MKSKLSRFLLAAIFAITGHAAYAATYSYEFLTEFSGGTPPDATAPWATLSFTDVIGGVELDLHLSGLTSPENAKFFGFNFGPNPGNAALQTRLSGLTFTNTGGQAASSISAPTLNAYKADGDGFFDILFNYPTSGDYFGAGEHSIYKITGSSVTASDFNYQSLTGGGNGIWYSALHVQQTGTSNGGSGWIGATVAAPVPEPEIYAMLAAGLGLMGFVARRRK